MKPLLCLALLTSSALPQTFQLGSTLDDVYLDFGAPDRWWEPEPQQYVSSFNEYLVAVASGTLVQDVYDRKTEINTYEIRLMRRPDYRDWLAAPTIRLTGLEFLLEKARPFRQTLADITEARLICAEGCNLYGLDDTVRYVVLAVPINPLEGQTPEATAAAYGYVHDFKPGHTYIWGIKLNFTKQDSFRKVANHAHPDWANSKIETVQIRPVSLDYELHTWSGLPKPQSLGSWKPHVIGSFNQE